LKKSDLKNIYQSNINGSVTDLQDQINSMNSPILISTSVSKFKTNYSDVKKIVAITIGMNDHCRLKIRFSSEDRLLSFLSICFCRKTEFLFVPFIL
jgi:hypothetical protein